MDDLIDWVDDFAVLDDFFENNDNFTTISEDDSNQEVSPLSLSTLSDIQERILSILLVLSAALSTIGSASIVYKILRDKQFSKPYHRTMLALSISDVIASLTFGLYPFLMPEGVRVWSVGNHATCTSLGFLTQLSFCAIGYNCMLSFYYLLAIRYNMKRKQFIQKFEKPMHAINLLYFLVTATVGVVYQFYAAVDVGYGCWVNNWPADCNLTGDCVSQQIAIVFAGIPVFLFFLAIVTNHLVVYFYVRHIFKSVDKVYAAQEEAEAEKQKRSYWDDANKPKKVQKGLTAKEAIAARKIARSSDLYEQKLQEVAIQAFLYVASFMISYTPALATRIVETLTYNYDDANIFWLLVITAITLPLQGFFNAFIYNRPHYVRIKEDHPNMPVLKAMRAAFLESREVALSNWLSGTSNKLNGGGGCSGPGARFAKRKSKDRFSKVGGSLEVVMEEASQMSESEVLEISRRSSAGGSKIALDAIIATDNDSTVNDTDNNSAENQDLLEDMSSSLDPPILKSPVNLTSHVVENAPAVDRIDIIPSTVSNTRQLDASSGEIVSVVK